MTDVESGSGSRKARGRGLKLSIVSAAVGVAMTAFAFGVAGLGGGTEAKAIAPCVQHTNTSEELQFLGLLQSWRNSSPSLAGQLSRSSSVNSAAYGFATYLAGHPDTQGHWGDGSPQNDPAPWMTRSIACGYPNGYGGGEGLAVVEASVQVSVSPQLALDTMTAEGGSGLYIPAVYHARCVGVGKAVSADGKKVAWVAVIMQGPAGGDCPQQDNSGPSDPSPNTPTKTNTPTATPTKTSTPSPTATPQARFGVQLQIAPEGWSLVTLPAGNIAQVLARAYGCYVVVYELRGDTWRRYSPDVPSYARNLTDSDGGAFWILGTAKVCGTISL